MGRAASSAHNFCAAYAIDTIEAIFERKSLVLHHVASMVVAEEAGDASSIAALIDILFPIVLFVQLRHPLFLLFGGLAAPAM